MAERIFSWTWKAYPGGDDWSDKINQTLAEVDAVLVLIGRRWLEQMRDREKSPRPDYVRLEIRESLMRPDLLVIPILVQGATLPAREDLPRDISSLSGRNLVEIRGASWAADADRLVKTLIKRGALPRVRLSPLRLALLSLASIIVLFVILKWVMSQFPRYP